MILRVNMTKLDAKYEEIPPDWRYIGGRGLIAKIMNREVPPGCNPIGPDNKLVITVGPLAGTIGPQLGRVSIGAKSPLTMGIKEANSGGPAAQKLDKLGVKAIIIEGLPENGNMYILKVNKDGADIALANEYKGMKVYPLVKELYKNNDRKAAIICTGVAGERGYKTASISLTDMLGDPSRQAARGGLGLVMAVKGIKAIVIDDSDTPAVEIADKKSFKDITRSWVDAINDDAGCGLFRTFGTPLTIAMNCHMGTMVSKNYRDGTIENFDEITGETIKKKNWARGGRMHACMPGCIVQCSIIYHGDDGKPLCSAFEYEATTMLGTNLGITDPDTVAKMKYICDNVGIDFMEVGAALGLAMEAGKFKMGDKEGAINTIKEIEDGTEIGSILGDGVVNTGKAFNIKRIPAINGQSIPGHEPRSVKGMGVTYVTSPQGADHTSGFTYRNRLANTGQIDNSLRSQIQAATCDTMGYCLNAVPGGRNSVYPFFAALMNARYGTSFTSADIFEIGKNTLRDEVRFSNHTEFSTAHDPCTFIEEEALPYTDTVFDVPKSDIAKIWDRLETFREPRKVWEIRFPKVPEFLIGIGTFNLLGRRVKEMGLHKPLIMSGPTTKRLGRVDDVAINLKNSGIDSASFTEVESDPPIECIEAAGKIYKDNNCDGIIAIGGGSSMDAAKATAVRVSQPGDFRHYENTVGGKARIKPPVPPIICIPTTSGTGSEANQYTVITDKKRNFKMTVMSDYTVPTLAVVDPALCTSMPPSVTASTGADALAHCIEGYVGRATPYHPYFSALNLYGVKLIGRSLKHAYDNAQDLNARTDMAIAAIFGGIAFTKGLGLGHAIGHALGEIFHIAHGDACALGLLCFTRAAKQVCLDDFNDLALALDGSNDLEAALENLFHNVSLRTRFEDVGIPEKGLREIAFRASNNAINLAANPVVLNEKQILELLKEFY